MPPTRPCRTAATGLLAAAALALALTGCGKGSGDPADDGASKQAVERLVDYGLPKAQARCIVEDLGAETVVEVGDLSALVDSQDYRDAARSCIGDG